ARVPADGPPNKPPPPPRTPWRWPVQESLPMTESSLPASFRCGHVAIVGRPNVGKSTLLNRLVGQKVSITSKKAQTTRHRITGILTRDDAQLLFVDTPGLQTRHTSTLNRHLNRVVTQALADADVILRVV